jgi:hypothetical protein
LSQSSAAGESLTKEDLASQVASITGILGEAQASPIAEMISKLVAGRPSIVSGEKRSLEILDVDGALAKLTALTRSFDATVLLRCMVLCGPALRVVELDARSGQATAE